MAVTVADDWQHLGIGTLLTKTLIEFASDHGGNKLYSVDLADITRTLQPVNQVDLQSRNHLASTMITATRMPAPRANRLYFRFSFSAWGNR